MKPIYTLKELERTAKRFIDGQIRPKEVSGLSPLDGVLVLQLAYTYALVKLGFLSRETASDMKLKYLSDYSLFKTRLFHIENIYEQTMEKKREASELLTKYAKLLKKDGVTYEEIADVQADIIAKLTCNDEYLFVYQKNKPKLIKGAQAIIDKLISKFGSRVPFLEQLEKLYAVINKDKRKEIWEQLSPDFYIKEAQDVPEKDSECKGLLESIEVTYYENRWERKNARKKLQQMPTLQAVSVEEQGHPVQQVLRHKD